MSDDIQTDEGPDRGQGRVSRAGAGVAIGAGVGAAIGAETESDQD